MQSYTRIGRPFEAHGVTSPDVYRLAQARALADFSRLLPHKPSVSPFSSGGMVTPFVNVGRWVVMCSCGNAPSYDPEWRLACCLECGAVYENVDPPADYQDAERILMLRRKMETRNWTVETLAALAKENEDNGEPVVGADVVAPDVSNIVIADDHPMNAFIPVVEKMVANAAAAVMGRTE